jgi:hypothetical protein
MMLAKTTYLLGPGEDIWFTVYETEVKITKLLVITVAYCSTIYFDGNFVQNVGFGVIQRTLGKH